MRAILFQFLSRNSVRWDQRDGALAHLDTQVSIPQSEFCPLGRLTVVKPRGVFGAFQFLSRNSVRWDFQACR